MNNVVVRKKGINKDGQLEIAIEAISDGVTLCRIGMTQSEFVHMTRQGLAILKGGSKMAARVKEEGGVIAGKQIAEYVEDGAIELQKQRIAEISSLIRSEIHELSQALNPILQPPDEKDGVREGEESDCDTKSAVANSLGEQAYLLAGSLGLLQEIRKRIDL